MTYRNAVRVFADDISEECVGERIIKSAGTRRVRCGNETSHPGGTVAITLYDIATFVVVVVFSLIIISQISVGEPACSRHARSLATLSPNTSWLVLGNVNSFLFLVFNLTFSSERGLNRYVGTDAWG